MGKSRYMIRITQNLTGSKLHQDPSSLFFKEDQTSSIPIVLKTNKQTNRQTDRQTIKCSWK